MRCSVEEEQGGPARPKAIEFLRVKNPERPVVLNWDPPFGAVAGYKVFATENRFPAHMAEPLFAGKMRQFIDEQDLDGKATEFRVARGDNYYGVIWFDEDDNYSVVENLHEPNAAQEAFVDIKAFVGTQTRTYLRVKYQPGVVPMRDEAVHIYVRDVEPNGTALGKMASGAFKPEHVLLPEGDGFIDTETEVEWRKYYVAVAVGSDGVRRPQDLKVGGFLRLEEPQYLARDGKRKAGALLEAIRDQIELDLQRRSVTKEDLEGMLDRADNLAPFSPVVARLREKAKERFG
ncbi:MAG: hypothetical protein ACI9MR_003650 [Myxococcota bacterium]|jgi:hypothetical protein